MILEKHLLFISFSYLCHYQVTLHERHQLLSCFLFLLDRNTIIFEGQKSGNEGSRSGAKGKRLLTVQVLEVTSKVSRVPHHVRDFSSVDPIFPSLQKPTFLNFNSTWNIVDEELLRGCPIGWIKDLVYIICVYYSYWDLLTQGRGDSSDSSSDICVTQRSASTQRPSGNTWALLDHQRIYHGCPVLKKSSFNLFLKYSVVYINRGCEWGKPDSDKGR